MQNSTYSPFGNHMAIWEPYCMAKNCHLVFTQNLHAKMYSGFIHNHQKLEINQMSFNGQIAEQIVV